MTYYLGIDIGTGESKGVLIDSDCNVVCSVACSHETRNPHYSLSRPKGRLFSVARLYD